LLAVLVLSLSGPPALADHGEWQSRQIWIEPVLQERTRTIPGSWEQKRVWIPPQTVTEEVTTTVPVEVEYQVFVRDGFWDVVHVWVEAYETQCRMVWKWYQDCSDFWGPCTRVYGPREECERVDVSYFELQRRWVDTSRWETRTRTEYRERTQTVTETTPGYWETRRQWKPGRTETYWHETEPGRWETTQVWTELPHEGAGAPACRPSGIYKVSSNYVGNRQWTDEDGTIHYATETSNDPNPWWAVRLGSVSKGSGSRYDALAFNGRGRGADGLLLAGRFYRNYLPSGDCFDPVSVVFFQDDSVKTGDLDQDEPTGPTEGPGAGSPTPTPGPQPTPSATPGPNVPLAPPSKVPTATPTPRPVTPQNPPHQPPVVREPGGEFRFAVAIEGSDSVTGTGRPTIRVLRGAPVEVYLLPRLLPPAQDPDALVSFKSWSYQSGPNDHPRAPAAKSIHGPLQPLRLRLDSRPPAGFAWHRIELVARVQVIAGDGRAEEFDRPVTLLAAVHYQAIA
jgi:hypothetical protein